jgi:uroporphyrinogen decarboxylase
VFDHLHIDVPITVGPQYVGLPIPDGFDMFGCRFEDVDYGTGVYRECVYHPLAAYDTVEAVEDHYCWPSADWFDFSSIPSQVAGRDARPVRGGGSEPFLRYTHLRGMELAYMDLVLRPDLVHHCLDKLFDLAYEQTRRIYEAIPGRVDISYVAEDFGSQENLLFSPDQIETFFIPRMKRMIDLAHEADAYVMHHSDGAIWENIPRMIRAGIDVLNPVQWRAKGMDRRRLKGTFGDQLVFHGAMDNQYTLPFGSVEDVRLEVMENIDILGQDGGYILAPCHNVQAVSPPENIVAMYETGYRYGRM